MCYNRDNLNDNINSNCYSNSSDIAINIILFIILSVIELVKWIIKIWPKTIKRDPYEGLPSFENRRRLTFDEIQDVIAEAEASGIIEDI